MNTPKQKDKSQPIQVFVRVKPLSSNEDSSVVDIRNSRELTVRNSICSRSYIFDRVFGPNSKQEDVYKVVAERTVSEVMEGYSCTVFAYGQTGTGKTYTMIGENATETLLAGRETPESGIMPRVLSKIFDELHLESIDFSIRVSFLMLYNEEIFDLLSSTEDTIKLKLYEDCLKKGSVIVHGLSECNVDSKIEVHDLIKKGLDKRVTAATALNANSSRAHTVFCVTIHIKESSVDGEDLLKTGKLYLVDLAGSENIKMSGATDLRAREACSINQSLLTLGRCIMKLMERSTHIPYRESKLTRLLQDSLGGRTKTSLIATISSAFCNVDESINTLEYATRAKCIQNKPEVNQRFTRNALLKEYTLEIERLKKDLLAARLGKGIYLNKDNYGNMLKEIDKQHEEIKQQINLIQAITEEKKRMESTCNELKMSLSETQQEVEVKQEEIDKLEYKLQQASLQINKLTEENAINKFVEKSQIKTERLLQSQSRELLLVADSVTTDAEKLHDKLDILLELNKMNKTTCEKHVNMLYAIITQTENSLHEFYKKENNIHRSTIDALALLQDKQNQYNDVCCNYKAQIERVLQSYFDFSKFQEQKIAKLINELKEARLDVNDIVTQIHSKLASSYTEEFSPTINILCDYIKVQEDLTNQLLNLTKSTVEDHMIGITDFAFLLQGVFNSAKTLCLEVLENHRHICSYSQEKLKEYITTQENTEREYEEKWQSAMRLLQEIKQLGEKHFALTSNMHHNYVSHVDESSDRMQKDISQLTGMIDESSQFVKCYKDGVDCKKTEDLTKIFTLEQTIEATFKNTLSSVTEIEKIVNDVNDEKISALNSIKDVCQKELEKQQVAIINITDERNKEKVKLETDINESVNKMKSSLEEIIEDSIKNIVNVKDSLIDNDDYCSHHESFTFTEIERCKEKVKILPTCAIKEYKTTGTTPVRRKYNYSHSIPETLPRDRLVAEFKRSASLPRLKSHLSLLEKYDENKKEALSESNKMI